MGNKRREHGKTKHRRQTGQKSEHAIAGEEVPFWQQDKQKGGRSPNGFRSQPRSVGKRYWRN